MKITLTWNKWLCFLVLAAAIVIGCTRPVTVEAATSYTTINVSKSDISSNSNGAYGAIQAALDTAKENATESNPYKVVVAKGSYELVASLHIYSNTWLYVDGVTFTLNKDSNMLMVGDSIDAGGSKQTGYCYKNITIEGGTWDGDGRSNTLIKAAHTSNITIKNCVVQNVLNNHLMEFAGVSGLTMTGCTLQNQTLTSASSDAYAYEAIQLDILEESHFNSYTCEDLATKNVVIDNCTFKDVPRGVGSHTTILNNALDGISITNCTFTDCSSCAIQGMNWINCTITGNTITGSPRGIVLYSLQDSGVFLSSTVAKEGSTTAASSTKYVTPSSKQNIVISDNTITCSGTDPYAAYESLAILVSGYNTSDKEDEDSGDGTGDTIPTGDYYISGATVSNNIIKTSGHGIRLYDTRNSTVTGNTITYTGSTSGKIPYYGIQLRMDSTGVTVDNNTIKKTMSNGIYVSTDSSASSITGNTITSPGKYGIVIEDASATTISTNIITKPSDNGIFIFDSSKVTTVTKNEITSAGSYGIAVNGATVTNITSNTISSAKTNAIYISNSAKVSGKISSNTISSPGKYGIDVEKATVKTISSNNISKAKSNGIFVYDSAKVTTISSNKITSASGYGIAVNGSTVSNIKSNTISKAKTNAIYISNSAKVTGKITSNTITSPGKYGIDVEGATVKTISSNTISSAKTNAIYVYSSATVTTISSNTITSPGKYGIDVEKATVKTITKNEISDASTNAIYVFSKGKVTTISSNTITSPGKYGIGIDGGTATTIKSNKITSPTSHGIFVQSSGKVKTITKNTIKNGKQRGISINCLKCDLTISSNTISKCAKDAEIYLAPDTTSYTITVKSNKITGKSTVDGIYAGTNCKVSISSNTIKSCNKAINLTTKVKGTVSKNTYSGNKSNKLTYGSKTFSNLSAPKTVTLKKASSTSIKVSWTEVSGADGYYVYRSTSKDGTYSKVATIESGSTTSYTNKSLKSGKTYYYKVVAYRKTSNGYITIISSYSSAKSLKL